MKKQERDNLKRQYITPDYIRFEKKKKLKNIKEKNTKTI